MNNKDKTIAIIDYGAGNIKSITNILDTFGYDFNLTHDPDTVVNSEKIIFPGQGHFAQAMKSLNNLGLTEAIKIAIEKNKNFLGICLGLQILFEESEEAPNVKGLGIFKGRVEKFKQGRIPQIGWNKIKLEKANTYLCEDFYYFVNSYYVVPEDTGIISSKAEYNIEFCSSVEYKNVVATQFHPEKSSEAGLNFFKNWLKK